MATNFLVKKTSDMEQMTLTVSTLYKTEINKTSYNQQINMIETQGHPTSIFGKYLFGRRFEI